MRGANSRTGRPPKDKELAVRHGVVVQPRFPRAVYREIKIAAQSEGLPIATWIKHLVFVALEKRKAKASTNVA
jgi:hypothetical protein